MKKHTKIYMDYFGFRPGDFIPCEISGDLAVDIHHIDARGMGGDPSGKKDRIDNLMALSRKNHEEYGDKKQFKEMLKEKHQQYMKTHGKK